MKAIGISGARKLASRQTKLAERELRQVLRTAEKLYVGDASGIDAQALAIALDFEIKYEYFATESYQPWHLQERSKRMVDALAQEGGTLHAFVNKPCPAGVTVNSWAGSGTWGTVRYAIALGLPVEIHWLIEPCDLPDWMAQKQMSLL